MNAINQTNNTSGPIPNTGPSFFSVIDSAEPSFLIPYVVITIFAIVGNIIIICIITTNNTMKTLHYRLLLNMAVADLIFISISPVHVYWELNNGLWFLGDAGCKIYYFVFRCLYAFSVLTLIVITTERFIAVRFPISFRHSRPHTVLIVSGVWFVSIAFSAPLIPVHVEVQNGPTYHCFQANWPTTEAYYTYHVIIYVVLYIIPLFVMIVLYAMILKLLWRPQRPNMTSEGIRTLKVRRKKARMVMLLVFSFFACWTPWSIFECLVVFGTAPSNSEAFFLSMHYSMLFVFASAAVNPILYGVLSEELRQAMRQLFGRCYPRLINQIHPQLHDNSMHISDLDTTRKFQTHHHRAVHTVEVAAAPSDA